MGCCEVHGDSTFLPPIQMPPSILQKVKRDGTSPKTVRFEISFTRYKDLSIQEELTSPWYEPVLNYDISSWTEYKKTSNLSLSYFKSDLDILAVVKYNFDFEISSESLICLINNPKYRMVWDFGIKRMEILIGDFELDALVGIVLEPGEKLELFDRKVRKFGDVICFYYIPHRSNCLDAYFLVSVVEKRSFCIYFKQSIETDIYQFLDNKLNWANKLLAELVINKNPNQ